jgi:primosomal protein N' (replication factor Y)
MSRTTLFADILLPLPVKGVFTYRIPFELNEFVEVGQRVAVQFGKRKVYSGLIKKLHEIVPEYTPKYILHLLDEHPMVRPVQFRFWEWISAYYMSTEGEVMNAALPSAFKLASESKVLLSPAFIPDQAILDEYEFLITEALLQKKRLTIGEISKQVGFQKVLPLLRKMIDKKMILMEEELEDTYKPKLEKYIGLAEQFQHEDELRMLMDDVGKRAFKQLELIMTFLTLSNFSNDDDHLVKKSDLLKKANAGVSALNALLEKGIFVQHEKVVSRFEEQKGDSEDSSVQLTEPQLKAYEHLIYQLADHRVVLLHGVTSGGKTEMYIRLIEETLRKGKQVLYLLPEIALTTQIINRLRKYFGDKVGVYHSRYNSNERAEVWKNVLNNKSKDDSKQPYQIILGPRSAIFLPFEKLGLIIVDEEHDQSYKQYDPAPRYNARDAAIYLATLHNAKVLLGSATPAIETYYNSIIGKFGLVQLMERYGGIKMPRILVVSMRDEMKRRMLQSHFTSVLMSQTRAALKNKQQVILFQNRRGFSLRVECEQCGWVPQCKNCDVTLTYHKSSEFLKCHYCGYSTTVPPSCADCGNTYLKMQGFGTEKVAEELSLLLPEARIGRMDLDTTRSKNSFTRIISDFEDGRTDILVGTQMVTKGLDFDNVHVVGILSADNMLSFPDFRAHERSYQLMAQVAGRAGRKTQQGKVVIQSWQPDHPIILDVVKNDYDNMYNEQLVQRKKFRYPPYYRLIIVKMKHKDSRILNDGASVFGRQLRAVFGDRVYGPEFPLVGRVRSFYIKQIMIKSIRTSNMADVKNKILAEFEQFRTKAKFKSILVQFDVDPQ